MKDEKELTLSDLLFGKTPKIFNYSENSCMPDIKTMAAQKTLVNDLLAYATNRRYNEFREGLDEECTDNERRRLIDTGIERLDLYRIVGKVEMYPEKRGNLMNLVYALFPGQDRLLSFLFEQESPLRHISKEVRSLCWELVEFKLKSLEPEKRIQFIEFISDFLFENINMGSRDDTQHSIKMLLDLCGRDEFEDFQVKVAFKFIEIAGNICQESNNYQTKQLKCINSVIRFMYQENRSPSSEMIRSVLPIFEWEFPYRTTSQKQHRNEVRDLAAFILGRCSPGKLKTLLGEYMSWGHVSTSIKIYGSLLYSDGASQSLKIWCAEEFKKVGRKITDKTDLREWVYSARGIKLATLLSQVGVTKEKLNTIFEDKDLLQEAIRIWESSRARLERDDCDYDDHLSRPVKDNV
jgi:hypothetical protein